jgi:hypothetical protein
MKRIFISFLLTLAMAAPALAGEMVGVTMPDSVSVNGKNLVLNGMGLRRKAFIKVYVAGLYLPQKMKGGNAIISADTERRMVMHFVRGVGKDKICNAWNEGLENNTPGASEELKKDFQTLCSYMESVESGGEYVFTYAPGSGTQVQVNGKNKGTIAGKDFADALFRCWIGPNPPGEDFKAGLVAG